MRGQIESVATVATDAAKRESQEQAQTTTDEDSPGHLDVSLEEHIT